MTLKSRRIEAISQWAENWRKGQEIEIIPFRVGGGHVVNRRFTSYFIKIGLSKLVHLYYLSTWEVEIKSIRSLRPIRATWDPVSINKERNKPRDWYHQSTCVFPFNSQSNEIDHTVETEIIKSHWEVRGKSRILGEQGFPGKGPFSLYQDRR